LGSIKFRYPKTPNLALEGFFGKSNLLIKIIDIKIYHDY